MRIWYNIPWSTEKNLGKAYNEFVKIISDEDYAIFLDRDAMFCYPFYGKQIEEIVNSTHADLYTCVTNRVSCTYQIADVDSHTNDLTYHVDVAKELADHERHTCVDITDNYPRISGVMMAVNKKTWLEVGGFNERGMLGIDNDFHAKVCSHGGRVLLMKGVYVYHWYRNGNNKNKDHLIVK